MTCIQCFCSIMKIYCSCNQNNNIYYSTNKNVLDGNSGFIFSCYTSKCKSRDIRIKYITGSKWNLKCAKCQSIRQTRAPELKVSKLYYSNISNKWNLEAFWENDFHNHLEKLSELDVSQGSCSNIWASTLE